MIVVKPEATILGVTKFLGPNDGSSSDPALLIERAGRVCWKSEGKSTPGSAAGFCDRVLRQFGHESISEHASATVHWVTDRIVANQLVRHRIAAYSQESTHYLNYSKVGQFDRQIRVCKPWDIEEGTLAYTIWAEAMQYAENAYFQLIEDCKVKHYEARYCLPLGLKSELVATYNFRTWVHVIRKRTELNSSGKPVNTPETHYLMLDTAKALMSLCPEVFTPKAFGIAE